ncbi:MAG: histidine--tRNA ligase [Ignavibacteria bacterium]|jgi:histidyl-tRNA synthetase|nr:histidine--tRNA ligase [Ignavibacteria bacterium]MCU7497936.1 histidine--tRNA ligase [Ignavibacteria bacterium]MCU7513399.1 histidine--tRNA ligase [Ignavibacteria bacterium]MCU7519852.1 histidine--tRNA ligase [Ignavibacteria bacterium]MCU7524113.1 histidine--tRNA ligase [Ignavibacteria bacterium]
MIKAITGTKDILPSDISKWKFAEGIINKTMQGFNYKEVRTPVFEETALFSRGIGEATDIVSKEMYTFLDKGGTSLTLRPEMTASVVRAFVEHSLAAKQNLNKLYYIAPMFRQERPQAGRLRQFHQFGAEAIGSTSAALDAEMIIMAFDILKSFGLKNILVKINSLGVPESRENYKMKLREYLQDKVQGLSEDSRKRFETNILRIFDSKEEGDQKIMEQAPLLIDYLDEESLQHFESVKNLLSEAGVPFEVDPKLVRGLDYYTKTTFEIVSGSVGSQSALCGGGRYDLLVEQLGGKPTPGVGFAAGIERILLACENENSLNIPAESIDLYIVRLENGFLPKVFDLGLYFRRKGIPAEFDYLERSVKAQMREANKMNARYVIILGGEEYNKGELVLKNMLDGTQENVSLDNMEYIANKFAG